MRLRMPCGDRLGLIHDISVVLRDKKINMISIEIDQGFIFLECHRVPAEQKTELMAALKGVPGIYDVQPISFMPFKERAEQLNAVLTTVQDGILAINRQGIVTQCNPAAGRILRVRVDDMLGQPLPRQLADDLLVNQTFASGRSQRNCEVYLESIGTYCIASTIPLRLNDRTIEGVVIKLMDNRNMRELVQKMTASRPVTFVEIPFKSESMSLVVGQARRYATSDSTVLIRGETGTGKELFARALHSASPRADNAFVAVNCAAIPETLLESELFGYEEGAFTGAVKGGKPGFFELANNGTLFLDEVGEVSVHLQAKLLRVLQDRRVRRLGSSHEIPIDVRIITATNRDLEDMVAQKLFREDLYYRLNVIPLLLPPLRERREDIALLAELFLRRFSEKLRCPARSFSPEALRQLEEYNWPGNVRELENVIERAVNLVDGPLIETSHFHLSTQQAAPSDLPTVDFATYQTLEERLAEMERKIVEETYKRFHSTRKIGAALGISHTAALRKLRKYGLVNEVK
ncbi:sigma 54-interacting transcriptional regulator [Desulforamulus aeronauticus]|uniref:HTH-type transcriptional regulatory protein TyrR n=1 Tax=Desulforamulus aeronauticus DSM 10349 TaxID=1121421 RepID=A0A1M6SZ97_9FIRM|nr:sigma 54-interacting transcriptional regulator [Desulforamulus aeronauticus]SHK50034.1 transcriptional regulator of aroF, aroG, tyrA and aromatic amino acid transport [Desulforamulus aeronauticus DSM 10349]